MRRYQIQGLDWMVSLHHNGLKAFSVRIFPLIYLTLADIFSFRASVKPSKRSPSSPTSASPRHCQPHLIVVSKSTSKTWHASLNNRLQNTNIIIFTGTKEEHAAIISNRLVPQDFEVWITSYEICLVENLPSRNYASSTSSLMRYIASRRSNPDHSHHLWTLVDHGNLVAEYLEGVARTVEFHMPKDIRGLRCFLHENETGAEEEEEKSKKVVGALYVLNKESQHKKSGRGMKKKDIPFSWVEYGSVLRDQSVIRSYHHDRWCQGGHC
jgi:SWI/SNF-related matrix-associated actin-dependent regulator of chromatin subfamily A member 5